MKRTAVILALLLCVCSPALQSGRDIEGGNVEGARPLPYGVDPSPQSRRRGQERPPTAEEQRIIELLMNEAETVRELAFVHPVPISIQDAEAISAEIEEQVEEERVDQVARVYRAIGLLDPDLDVKALLIRVMGEQILGYFDPRERRLVIRDDIMRAIVSGRPDPDAPALEDASLALVHELVHALQSQHLSLSSNLLVDRSIDGENAFSALVEGDATLAMIDFARRQKRPGWRLSELTTRPELIREMVAKFDQLRVPGDELEKAPAVLRVPLISAYIDGMSFVAHLHGRGGWNAVNHAHRRPPLSSEQVLHPERYQPDSPPKSRPLPVLEAFEERGFAPEDEETLGELEMGVFFGLALDRDSARSAAAGWGWDRLQLWAGSGKRDAVVWYSFWDDESEAREAERAAAAALESLGRAGEEDAGVVRRSEALLIWLGIPKGLHAGLKRAFDGWSGMDVRHGP